MVVKVPDGARSALITHHLDDCGDGDCGDGGPLARNEMCGSLLGHFLGHGWPTLVCRPFAM